MVKQKITACTVAYHEEKVIERLLKSLKGVADEIIFVHDGPCHDRTLEIASKYTSNIYIGPRKGDLAPHLPFCLQKTKGEWLLVLGADEFLIWELRRDMKKLVLDRSADAYAFLNENWCDGKLITKGVYGKFWRLQLYRTSKIVREPIHVNGAFRTTGNIKRLPYHAGHRPLYENYTMETFRKKSMRLLRLEAAYASETAGMPAVLYFLRAPIIFMHHFWTLFKQDIISSGWAGWKMTFYLSLYYFMLSIMNGKYKITGPQEAWKMYEIPYDRKEEPYRKYAKKAVSKKKQTS